MNIKQKIRENNRNFTSIDYKKKNFGKKIEKNNVCFFSYYDFKKTKNVINFVKKKISSFERFTKVNELDFFWDKERNVYFFLKKLFKFYSGFVFRNRIFLNFEEIYILNLANRFFIKRNMHVKLKKKGKYIYNFLTFIFLISNKLYIQRFYFLEKLILKPNFLCFSLGKNKNKIFSTISFYRESGFKMSFNFSILIMRLKPGFLKVLVFGKSNFIVYSIETGICSSCPLFKSKDKKIKSPRLNISV
mmetsp:Transcript_44335/g.105615  ORF Transcript_44335/g.105615 Transcript_44335/m.105615 type:complete len:246 (-) Transcript_44335:2443-3180(-)